MTTGLEHDPVAVAKLVRDPNTSFDQAVALIERYGIERAVRELRAVRARVEIATESPLNGRPS